MNISVCIPTHDMPNANFFMKRCLDSLRNQTYKSFEVVVTTKGKMAENTNSAIKQAKGEIVKILFMDDYLHPQALQNIADNFEGGWLASGCEHDNGEKIYNQHIPSWNEFIHLGNNTIGSPSVIAFENNKPLLFDEKMSWLLDCDLYRRLYERYGMPTLLESIDVVIGIGDHQTTNLMSDEEKAKEHKYIRQKYEN